MLNDAEKIYRSLAEEIEFVRTYLELEKLRFEDNFNYEFQISNEVDITVQVPKMVLQTHAENAVKHGLMLRETGGLLKINIQNENEYLVLTVEDNGIGREKASGKSSSTGMGIKLTEEFYQILNEMYKKSVMFKITDLSDQEGKAAGTRVVVSIPFEKS